MTRKILLPLTTVLAAGAIAVGSGATFTSTSGNTISAVTSGTLTHSNTKDGQALFNLTNMKPGDVVTGSLTLKNTGSLPATFSLTETKSNNAFTGANLTLDIADVTAGAPGTPVFSGTFGALVDGAKTNLGDWAPNETHTYKFTVKLADTTTNVDQNKTADAIYAWDSVQLTGQTFNQ